METDKIQEPTDVVDEQDVSDIESLDQEPNSSAPAEAEGGDVIIIK